MVIKTEANSFQQLNISGLQAPLDAALLNLAGRDLAVLFAEYEAFLNQAPNDGETPQDFTPSNTVLNIANGAVVIEAVAADGSGARLLQHLQTLGLEHGASYLNTVSGLMPISQLGALTSVANLGFAMPSYAFSNVGSVENRADFAMETDLIRSDFGFDGTGITIGILSDSFDTAVGQGNATISYADDIASGDLPAGIPILEEYDQFRAIDEGRAMAQLIHDVAPGANLAFATAFLGQTSFANNILALANISDVVVDDIYYSFAPFFQDGVIAQAVDAAFAGGTQYYSSAGNFDSSSYEADFAGVSGTVAGLTGTFHDFDPGPGVDLEQDFFLAAGQDLRLVLQWDDPYIFGAPGSGGAVSDLDVVLIDTDTDSIISSATFNNIGNDPVEGIFNVAGGTDRNVALAIQLSDGPAPNFIKYIDFTSNSAIDGAEYATFSGASVGHSSAEGGLGVGAAWYQNTPEYGVTPPLLNGFSSLGGTPIFFDAAGNRLATPEMRDRVDITGPDGSDTTFFGSNADDTPAPNFFGTSAAAPHVAALGALLLEADGTLTPTEVYDAIQAGAIDITMRNNGGQTGVGFDDWSGSGLVNAPQTFAAAGIAGGNLIVTIATDEDDGNVSAADLSLREAINIAQTTDQNIVFSSTLAGQTIRLDQALGTINITDGTFSIDGDVLNDGRGRPDIVISGDTGGDDATRTSDIGQVVTDAKTNINTLDNVQIFNISGTDAQVDLNSLTLTGGGPGVFGSAAIQGALQVGGDAVVSLDKVTVEGNTSDVGGGLIAISGTLNITDSSIVNNVSAGSGGAIYTANGVIDIINSTFSGNEASNGGAIVNFGSNITLSNATLTDNMAINGAGILNANSVQTQTTLVSTIVAGNSGSEDLEFIDVGGGQSTFFTLGNNLIGSESGTVFTNGVNNDLVGTAATPLNPMLSVLGDFGGPNVTHVPLTGSAALDAGANPDGLLFDQRGDARVLGTAIDIGATETLILPDLVAQTFTANANTVAAGDVLSFNWTVVNNGPGTSGTFDTGVYFSTDQTVTTQDIFVGYLNTDNVDVPGSSQVQSLNSLISVNLAPGTYYAAAIADDISQQAETDETNNASNLFQVEVTAPTPPTAFEVRLTDEIGAPVGEFSTIVAALAVAANGYAIATGANYAANPETVNSPVLFFDLDTDSGQTTTVNFDDTLFGGLRQLVTQTGEGNLIVNGSSAGGILNGSGGDDVFNGTAGDIILNGNGGNDTANIGALLADVDFSTPSIGSLNLVYPGGTVNMFRVNELNLLDISFAIDNFSDVGSDTFGSSVNDIQVGDDVANILSGFAGQDVLLGGVGNDTLIGGLDADTLVGGDDQDTADYSASDGRVDVNLLFGTGVDGHAQGDVLSEIENVVGSVFNDRIVGDPGSNELFGGDGVDNINGRSGVDYIYGGEGSDLISGAADGDYIAGNVGDDRIFGNGGGDVIAGDAGMDSVFGGTGNDLIFTGADNDSVLGQGNDDTIRGNGGDDTLRGGSGNDEIEGGDDNDVLFGNGNNDTLSGGDGNDSIQGNAGQDQLFGGDGDDTLFGGTAGDRLDGGTGDDLMNGGTNDGVRDVFVFLIGYDEDRINQFDQAGTDRVELDTDLWIATNPALSQQGVVDLFGTLNSAGTILTLDFGGGDILEVQNSGGIDETTFGADIFFV